MNIIDPILEEYKHECAATRKYLERTPDSAWGWRPHEKSMSLGQLVSHMADMNGWVAPTMAEDVFVLDMSKYIPFLGTNAAEVLALFDEKVAEGVEAMKGASNEHLLKTWIMKTPEGHVMMQMPRVAVIRGMFINHMIHHRGQLSVYLRMQNVPLPATYGPSADEGTM